MFGFVLFILGAIVGTLATLGATKKLQMPWYGWAGTAAGLFAILMAFEVLIFSLAEFEPQAGIMSFGLFGLTGVIVLAVVFKFCSPKAVAQRAQKPAKTKAAA